MRSLIDVLHDARARKIAVGHFNFSDLTALRAVAESARELEVPVMVGVSEGERDFVGVRESAALVRCIRDEHGQEIYLNADHTHSLERAEQAARAGFDEIIFDGSSLPFDKNLAETRRAVEAIKSINPAILVEGEIGYIGASSAILDKVPEGMSKLTTPIEAKQFVEATRIDVLAPAVGNMHGMLKSMVDGNAEKRLAIDRVGEISKAVGIFMTLHGGSGTNDDDFRAAIRAGMTIVHVNTEIRIAWRRGVESVLKAEPEEIAPYKILPGALAAIKEVVASRIRLFSFI
jgi:fructose-bisphosphate aldolase class II